MSASSRQFRANFSKPVRVSDGAGGNSLEWQPQFDRWVGLRLGSPVVSDEAVSEAAQVQVLDHRMTVPDDPETRLITLDWRVTVLKRTMEVRSVGVPIGGETQMSVQEGVST